MIAAAALCRRYIYREIDLNLVVRVILLTVIIALASYSTIVWQVQMELCFAITLHFALRKLGYARSWHIAKSNHFLFVKSDLLRIFLDQLDACSFKIALHFVFRTLRSLHLHKLLERQLKNFVWIPLVLEIGLNDADKAVRRTLVQYFFFHNVKDGLEGFKAIVVAEGHMKRIRVIVVDKHLRNVGPAQISICISHHHVSDCKITLAFDLIFLVNFGDYPLTIFAFPIA